MADATAAALRALGYELRSAVDPRNNTAHRFLRGTSTIDLVTGAPEEADKTQETVDVLVSDHHAPSVTERLAGRDMVQIEGGTQALRRTINARLEITPGTFTTISVPRPFGAVVLKSAAHKADSRDPDRHLYDAAALLACIDDPFAEREEITGSDRPRLIWLRDRLPAGHPAWTRLPARARDDAMSALDVLTD